MEAGSIALLIGFVVKVEFDESFAVIVGSGGVEEEADGGVECRHS